MKCADFKDKEEDHEEGIKYGGEVWYWWGIIAGLSGPPKTQVDPRAVWYCVSAVEEA